MKLFKTVISALLCLTMAFSSGVICYADDNFETERQNPFYSGKDISRATLDSLETEKSSTVKTLDSKKYYSDGLELYKIMRDNFVKRNTNFTINYLTKSRVTYENVIDRIEKLYVNATEEALSEGTTDGDYIRWVVGSFSVNRSGKSNYFNEKHKDGYYYYNLDLSFTYYDSAQQEKEVDKVVNAFVASIDTNSLTDYQIIKKIHDFICSKTVYDDYAAENNDGNEYAATAYGALVKGKCICQGYSVAFYRICKELGYSVRFVSSNPKWGCHAWNLVMLDGKYYYVDATWDDTFIDSGETEKANTYLLVNYKTLRLDDSIIGEHTLDNKYYDDEYFCENTLEFIDESNYDKTNKNLLSQSVIKLDKKSFTYTGSKIEAGVYVVSNEETPEFSLSYSKNKNVGTARVDLVSKDNSRVLSQRQFVISPGKMTALSLASSGRTETSLQLAWSKTIGASGFEIEIYEDGNWFSEKKPAASSTSAKITNLNPATKYTFRIRSYVSALGKNYYSPYSKVYKTSTKPKSPKISSLSTKSKSITVKWKKVKCSGYEIEYSTDKSMKNAKTIKISSSKTVSKKIKNLKKGKKYYFRIRAFKNYTSASGKNCTCYSSRSAKNSIICK